MITLKQLALIAVSILIVAAPLRAEESAPPAIPSHELPADAGSRSTSATSTRVEPRLGDVTPALQPLVEKMLYEPKDGHREDAAEDLEKVGDSTCIAALQWAAANDTEKDVRKHAARAIEKISHRTAPVVVAAPPAEPRVIVVPSTPQVVYAPAPVVVYTAPHSIVYSSRPICYPRLAPVPVIYGYRAAPCYRPSGFYFSYRSSGHHRH